MEKYLTVLRIFIKLNMRKLFTYVMVVLTLLILFTMHTLYLPDNRENRVLVYDGEGSKITDDIMKRLTEDKEAFEFIIADSPEEVREEVKKGRAECGFIFSQELSEKLLGDDRDELIEFVISPFTVKGYAARERVFAELLRSYAPILLEDNGDALFFEKEAAMEKVILKYRDYLDGDSIFKVRAEYLKDTENSGKEGNIIFPVHGMAGVIIFICVFTVSGKKYDGTYLMLEKYKGIWTLCYALPAILVSFLCIRLWERSVFWFCDLGLLFLLFLFSVIWCRVFFLVIPRGVAAGIWAFVIMFAAVSMTPVFWDPGKAAYILPSGAYVRMLGFLAKLS